MLGGVIVAALIALYIGSAVVGVTRLGQAVQSRDAATVLQRVDLASIRRSISQQVVAAYLAQAGTKSGPTARAQRIASIFGPSVADAMLSKVITAQNLATLLKSGRIPATSDHPEIGLPNLSAISADDVLDGLTRVRLVQANEFALELGELDGIRMRLDGTTWKMSALDLRSSLTQQIASRLPAGDRLIGRHVVPV